MLLPTTIPTLPADARVEPDDSMTDDYGEPSEGRRTLGGGVDFFSSLGTDIKRKPKPQRPDPDKVWLLPYLVALPDFDFYSARCQLEGNQRRSRKRY